jgi:hypothetical protein
MPGMSEERKPLWPWIVALLIGLPVLYMASFGPACWWLSEPVTLNFVAVKVRRAPTIYSPIGRLARNLGPGRISNGIHWYATVGIRGGEGVACGMVELGDPGLVFLRPDVAPVMPEAKESY